MGDKPAEDREQTQATRLLNEAGADRASALLPLVYGQLRAVARRRMAEERKDHTLDATALVHEVYLRLVSDEEVRWDGRRHFYAAAAEAMRRILVEHARARGCVKRGGGRRPLPASVLDLAAGDEEISEIVSLDDAIRRLGEREPRMAEIVRLRFFAGLSIERTAAAMDLSAATVKRDLRFARAWLHEAVNGDERREHEADGP